MLSYAGKQVLVIGPGERGAAAGRFLLGRGARVSVLRHRAAIVTPELEKEMEAAGAAFLARAPAGPVEMCVLGPELAGMDLPVLDELRHSGTELLSELDLGLQNVRCLCVAISGTNGKSTMARILESILQANDRKTVVAGHPETPICAVIDDTKNLDYLLLNLNAAQLEVSRLFRPAVAVLLNSAPATGRQSDELLHTYARLFQKQQVFDWTIVQSGTLKRLQKLDIPVPGKVITFSSTDPAADLYFDRGLIQSRVPNWAGPLLDLDACGFWAPHAAEDVMAALAVGRVLRLHLERMVEGVKAFVPRPHRFELVGQIAGVAYINDSKSANLDALEKALLGCRPAAEGRPNVLLIAGGVDAEAAFHDAAPLVAQRVKHAFLIGEAGEKIRAAWSLFTPCTVAQTLLEAVHEAAKNAVPGDVVLLSPACSSFDQFRDFAERGEIFCAAVKSISGGAPTRDPHIIRNSSAAV